MAHNWITAGEPAECHWRRAEPGLKAFGVEPSPRAFDSRLAHYTGMADALEAWLAHDDDDRPARVLDVSLEAGRLRPWCEALGLNDRLEWRLMPPTQWQARNWGEPLADVVVADRALAAAAEPGELLEALLMRLRPGGLLLAGVPCLPGPLASLSRIGRGGKAGALRAFGKREFLDLLFEPRQLCLQECRGFAPWPSAALPALDQYYGWYRFNRRLGRALPGLCSYLQVAAVRL